jgi:hypothetical protein
MREEGLQLGGETLISGGPLYFNARCAPAPENADPAYVLSDGRLTVKEDLGSNVGLFQSRGILAEFKIVGGFEISPREAS